VDRSVRSALAPPRPSDDARGSAGLESLRDRRELRSEAAPRRSLTGQSPLRTINSVPFIPVPNVWKVTCSGQFVGVPWQYNLWWKWSASPTLTQALTDSAYAGIEAAYDSSGIESILGTDWTLNKVVVTDMTSSSAPQFNANILDALVGESGASELPPQTAGVIEWFTSLRGRSFRGRIFHPGFTTAAGTSSPSVGGQASMVNLGNALLAFFHAAGPPTQDLAVVSLFSGMHDNVSGHGKNRRLPNPRAAGVATTITSCQAETVWKTQRRRAVPG
jgi:hypothetical protein